MRKKQQEQIVINPNEPLCKCYDCIHWGMLDDGKRSGIHDFSSGRCYHNGYTKCPPMFTCGGWESGNGAIIDKLSRHE